MEAEKNKIMFVSSYLDMDIPGTYVYKGKLSLYRTYDMFNISGDLIPKSNQNIYMHALLAFLSLPNDGLTLKVSIIVSAIDSFKFFLPKEIVGRIYKDDKIIKEFKNDINGNIYRSIALWPDVLDSPLYYQDIKISSEKTIYKWSSQNNWKKFFLDSIDESKS